MIELKKIKDINYPDQVYYIPSYQRGYRWENKQVIEFLDDIYEVFSTNQDTYCLQPIVISKLDENIYEIIDGQQRLTTIFIILTRLKRFAEDKFQLDFESRKNCLDFFKKLEKEEFDYSNPDFSHISNAYKVIDSWLKDKKQNRVDSNIELNIFQTLLEKVEIIWYDVEESNRENLVKVFTRLNSGKIELTNAELIKALFLSKANFDKKSNEIYTSQLDISNKWNQIENSLQNNEFWDFINKSENNISTRIDYIFQLIVKSKGHEVKENLDVFRYYYPLYVKSIQDPNFDFLEKNWSEVELYFTLLQDWFKNNEYFNLIGLLIWDGEDLLSLINEYQKSNKKVFRKYLFEQINIRFCQYNLAELKYKSIKDVEKTLVLFNVMEVYRFKTNRFPFQQLKQKNTKWSIEHIHPQNALDVKQTEYIQWLKDHKKALEILDPNEEIKGLLLKIIKLIDDINDTKSTRNFKLFFEELSREILECLNLNELDLSKMKLKSNISLENLLDDDHISNLALLDTKRNSSIGNSAFAVKRKSIIDFEINGIYIPNATKNSFLKYYSDFPKHLNYWTIEDRDEYISKIQAQINYIKNFKIEENEY
jgi:uncharacterized protein with ParB-like and HNH nuclease domain